MRTVSVSGSPSSRAIAFIDAFERAPNDADIEFRIGQSDKSEPGVLVSFQGTDHAFTTSEARVLADVFENTLNKFPDVPETRSLPNMILGFRMAADKADQRYAKRTRRQ